MQHLSLCNISNHFRTNFQQNLSIVLYLCVCFCSLQIVLHTTNMQKIHKLVYTAYSEDTGDKLKYCVKVNGAISMTTNQEPKFLVQSTPAGICKVIYLVENYCTE